MQYIGVVCRDIGEAMRFGACRTMDVPGKQYIMMLMFSDIPDSQPPPYHYTKALASLDLAEEVRTPREDAWFEHYLHNVPVSYVDLD